MSLQWIILCGCVYTALLPADVTLVVIDALKVVNTFKETYQSDNNKAVYCVNSVLGIAP